MNTIFHAILSLIAIAGILFAQEPDISHFMARKYTGGPTTLPYRLAKPKNYDSSKKYPLMVFLHGTGMRGNDNKKQLVKYTDKGAMRTNPGPLYVAGDEVQAKNPSFVLVPQCPSDDYWWDSGKWRNCIYSIDEIPMANPLKSVYNIVEGLIKEFSIDTDRLYIGGHSMGGYGSWDMITRFPNIYAAAIPLCGGCDPSQAEKIAHIGIWTFHGSSDPTVPPKGTQAMAAALKNAPDFTYTELAGAGHMIWRGIYADDSKTRGPLIDWLFTNSKSGAVNAKPDKKDFAVRAHNTIGAEYYRAVYNISGRLLPVSSKKRVANTIIIKKSVTGQAKQAAEFN